MPQIRLHDRPLTRRVMIRPREEGGFVAIFPERNVFVAIDDVSAILLRLADGNYRVETLLAVGTSLLDGDGEEARKAVLRRLERAAEYGLIELPEFELPVLQDEPAGLNRTYVCLTNRCNLTCPYCYADSSPREPVSDDLTLEELDRLAGQLARTNPEMLVILTGGEPLLREDLPQIMRLFKGRGLRLDMFTNLLPLTPHKAESLWILDGISCSYHDILPEVARREDDFVERLRLLRTVAGLSPTVQKTLTHGRAESDLAFIRRMLERGYPVIPNWFDPVGRGAEHPELQPDAEEALFILRALEELRTEFGELVGPLFDFNFQGHQCAEACGAATTTVMIRSNGDVQPCSNLLSGRFKMGNIRVDPVEKLMRSQVADEVVPPISIIEECSTCEYRHTCYGGCRANTFAATGRFDRPDPKCEIYKMAIEMQLGIDSDREINESNHLNLVPTP